MYAAREFVYAVYHGRNSVCEGFVMSVHAHRKFVFVYGKDLCTQRICVCREFVHAENLCTQRISCVEFHMHNKYVCANIHVYIAKKKFVCEIK